MTDPRGKPHPVMSSGEGVVMKYKASEAVWTMKGFMRHAKGFGFLP